MSDTLNLTEIKERERYQRAIYNRHKCDNDDTGLKEYLDQIIRTYEVAHKSNVPALNKKFLDQFDGRGIA